MQNLAANELAHIHSTISATGTGWKGSNKNGQIQGHQVLSLQAQRWFLHSLLNLLGL